MVPFTTTATDDDNNQVPTAYLFVARNLHRKMHFSCSKSILEQLKRVCMHATFQLCIDDEGFESTYPFIDNIYEGNEYAFMDSFLHTKVIHVL